MIGPAKASGLTAREIAEAMPAFRYQPPVAAAAAKQVPEGGASGSQKVRTEGRERDGGGGMGVMVVVFVLCYVCVPRTLGGRSPDQSHR